MINLCESDKRDSSNEQLIEHEEASNRAVKVARHSIIFNQDETKNQSRALSYLFIDESCRTISKPLYLSASLNGLTAQP